ncbi:hypothetical protein WJX72_002188 [[Myrmecia] bisecta]|uniref:Core Histone H2A/H2B/H3 domain-containing protein n=1 Tax=[Myrmecia] bisecta TaxID=41462 RepID=A0AAW1R688_9CHLO
MGCQESHPTLVRPVPVGLLPASCLEQTKDPALLRQSRAKHGRKHRVNSDALDDLMERLASECKHLVQSNNRATLTARDVEGAVRLLIPSGLLQMLGT